MKTVLHLAHVLACAALLALDASAGTGELAAEYAWKPKTIYRFEYFKTVRVERHDATQAAGEAAEKVRSTAFSGVLVLDVTTCNSEGTASAEMRFDNPRIEITLRTLERPALTVEVTPEQERARSGLTDAMEKTLRELRWKVDLRRDGRLRVVSREKEKLAEVLEKINAAGGWRKKSIRDLYAFIEESLGLGVSAGLSEQDVGSVLGELLVRDAATATAHRIRNSIEERLKDLRADTEAGLRAIQEILTSEWPGLDGQRTQILAASLARARDAKLDRWDSELLFCPGQVTERLRDFDVLRPKRVPGTPKKAPYGRVDWPFEREARAVNAAVPLVVKLDPSEPEVQIEPGKVESRKGRACFDQELGVLDEAEEEFSVVLHLGVTTPRTKLNSEQTVSVVYRLKRLAPPLRGEEIGPE